MKENPLQYRVRGTPVPTTQTRGTNYPKSTWDTSDQGFQYQHSSWRNLIHDNGGVQSMSRKANCYDNAVMENFFGHLKTEMYHGEVFDTVAEFNQAIDEYIQWYNTERIQQRLKGLTPMQYRNQTLEALTA